MINNSSSMYIKDDYATSFEWVVPRLNGHVKVIWPYQ